MTQRQNNKKNSTNKDKEQERKKAITKDGYQTN